MMKPLLSGVLRLGKCGLGTHRHLSHARLSPELLNTISITDSGLDPLDLVFEGVSAFGTVGLSSGATSQLSVLGQLVLMLTMLDGRLGPLTIGLAMAHGPQPEVKQYWLPKEYVAAA